MVDWSAHPIQAGAMAPARGDLFGRSKGIAAHVGDAEIRIVLVSALKGLGIGAEDPRSESALVRAAQDGSEEALEALFRRHWQRAHRAAYLIVRDPQAAEDITQEAFLAAIRSLERFDRRRPFGPWLHRIVVNRAIDHARARALRREVQEGSAGEAVAAPDRRGLDEDVAAALVELGVEQRVAIVLRYLLDYTPGEIARILDLPRGTVNSRLRRGLDRLAAELAEQAP
jgi:RNA polymerase sigma-70 factor, ECF subfamily